MEREGERGNIKKDCTVHHRLWIQMSALSKLMQHERRQRGKVLILCNTSAELDAVQAVSRHDCSSELRGPHFLQFINVEGYACRRLEGHGRSAESQSMVEEV